MPYDNLEDFQEGVERLVRDGGDVLGPADYDQYIQDALKRLSRAEPRKVVADFVGDGGYDYTVPSPFDPDFSSILEVEYPAGRREPSIVDKLDWTLYASPSGTQLRFLADSPTAAETIRVTFTAMHTVDESTTTVPAPRADAVVLLSAALACEALASHYSNTGDSMIQADSVDHKSKASDYAARAQRFMKMATELLPIAEQGEAAPASTDHSLAGDTDFLTHPER